MNVIDYAVDSVEAYKKEKLELDKFINNEIVIPCSKKGFRVTKCSRIVNTYRNYPPEEDAYSIILNNKKIIELCVIKLHNCVNGSKYILQCIRNTSILSKIYSNQSCFSETNKQLFLKDIGHVLGEFLNES